MTLLAMTRGDTATFEVALTDEDGAAVDLAGMDLFFTAKRRYQDADEDAIIAKSIGLGITVTDEPGGLLTITVDSADTAALTDRALYWDLQVVAGADVRTPLSGRLQITPDVTQGTGS